MKTNRLLIASNISLLLVSISVTNIANAKAYGIKNGKSFDVLDCHSDTNRYKDGDGWHDYPPNTTFGGCSRATYNPNANSPAKKGIDAAKLEKVEKPKAVKKLPKEAKKGNTQKAVKPKNLVPKTAPVLKK